MSVSLWNDLTDPVFGVWNWRVSRAGPMPFYWPSCSLPFCLLLFSLSPLSLNVLVLWGWGLRTDRVLITLSQPCIINFNNNNNNNNNDKCRSFADGLTVYICSLQKCCGLTAAEEEQLILLFLVGSDDALWQPCCYTGEIVHVIAITTIPA